MLIRCSHIFIYSMGGRTDLVYGVGVVVIVNDIQFDGVGKVEHGALLDAHDAGHGDGDLNAIALVLGAEDGLLQRLDPLLGAGSRVGAEVVLALIGGDGKVTGILSVAAVHQAGRDAVAEIDAADGEVRVGRVGEVGQHIAFKDEPVAGEFYNRPAPFGQVTGFGRNILNWLL